MKQKAWKPKEGELEAKARLEPLLGRLHPVDVPGTRPGMHDFETTLHNGSLALIEVLSEVDEQRRKLESAANDLVLTLPGSSRYWTVRLMPNTKVKTINRNGLLQLLHDAEAHGRRKITDGDSMGDPLVARLISLGAESAHSGPAITVPAGTVRVRAGIYGGSGWRATDVDRWLAGKLDPVRSHYHADKLRGGGASQRHMAIVLDSFSEAGIGVSQMLTASNETGAAGEFLPMFVPPHPLTHLWIFVRSARAYLRWAAGEGWAILEGAFPLEGDHSESIRLAVR